MTRAEAEELARSIPGARAAEVKKGRVRDEKESLYLDMPDGDWEMVSPKPGLELREGDFCVVRRIVREEA